jgi:hypothetical protein
MKHSAKLNRFAFHSPAADGLDTSGIQAQQSNAGLYYSILTQFDKSSELTRIDWVEMVFELK